MPRVNYVARVTDLYGVGVTGAEVKVLPRYYATPVLVYGDSTTSTPLSTPVTSVAGKASFWLDDETAYNITVDGDGLQQYTHYFDAVSVEKINNIRQGVYFAPGTTLRQGSMPILPWAPTPTTIKVVDTSAAQFGITWSAEPDIQRWRGKYYLVADINPTGGTSEGASGQVIGLFTSTNRTTWTYVGRPFNDSSLCNNVITDAAAHFQPGLIAPNGDAGPLECYWANGKLFVSTLTDPSAKWTNKRFWWNGTEPVLTNVINGNTATGEAAGLDYRPTIDGHTYDVGMTFFSRPIVLANGRTVAPTIGRSSDLDPNVASTESTFTRQFKIMFNLLREPDGSWSRSEPISCGNNSTPGGLWESFAVEADNGDVRLYGLNKLGTIDSGSAMWTAVSNDGGRTFSQTRDTGLETPTQRSMAIRDSDTRYVMVACDNPSANTAGNTSTARYNMVAYISRRGLDDFIPGPQISDQELTAQYGQIIEDGYEYVAVWHRDQADNNPHGRDLMLTTVSRPTDANMAYVYPRHLSERTISGPSPKGTNPVGFHFSGTNQATFNTAPTNVGGGTMSAWVIPYAGSTDGQVICDRRDNTGARAGSVLRPDAFVVRTISVPHGVTLTRRAPAYVAGSIDYTAQTLTVAVGQSGTFTSVTHEARAITFTGNPTNGQTITINSVLYTFKTSAGASPDVQIGADLLTTATNLATVIGTSNAAVVGTADMVVKRSDGAAFTITAGTAPITVLSALPTTLSNANCVPRVGYKNVSTSTLPAFVGDMIDVQVWAKPLSVAELKNRYNQHAADTGIGYGTVAGASVPSGSPDAQFTSASTSATWTDLDVDAPTCTVAGTQLTMNGEACAALEQPYPEATYPIVFKLPDAADGDVYTLSTWDTPGHAIELKATVASGVTTLTLNDRTVGTVADVSRFTRLRIVVSDKAVNVGGVGVRRTASGSIRCYLGCANQTGTLSTAKRMIFETSGTEISEYRGASLLDELTQYAIIHSGASDLTDDELDALLPEPQPAVPIITDPSTEQVMIRTGGTIPWTRLAANVTTDGISGSFPRQYETLSSPDGTHYGHLCTLNTAALNERIDLTMLIRDGGDAGLGVYGTGLLTVRLADNGGTVDKYMRMTEIIPFETAAGRIDPNDFYMITTQSNSGSHLYTTEIWVKLDDPNAKVYFVPLVQAYSGTAGGITFYNKLPNPRVASLPTNTETATPLVSPTVDTTTYQPVLTVSNRIDAATVTGSAAYGLAEQAVGTFSGSSGARGVFYFNPADYVPAGYTAKIRMRLLMLTNATAPGIYYTFGMYPVSGSAGGAVTAVSATVGSVVSGSTSIFSTPTSSAALTNDTGDFTAPAAGLYAFGFQSSGAMTANSSVQARVQLLIRPQ